MTWTIKIVYVADIGVLRAHRITDIPTARDASDARKTIIQDGFLLERIGDTLETWIPPSALMRIQTLCYEEEGEADESNTKCVSG